MSVISNVALWCNLEDEETVLEHLPIAGQPLQSVGGNKVLCVGLFAWAENYLDLPALLQKIESLSWHCPSSVTLLVEHEDEEAPAIWRFGRTEHYFHNPEREGLLDEAKQHKLVKVVKARAG